MIKTKEIMQKPVPWINVKAKVKEALDALSGKKTCLVVLKQGVAVGILTKDEILSAFSLNSKASFNKLTIEKIMSHKFVFVEEELKLNEVNEIMKDQNVDYIVVGKSVKEKEGHSMDHINGIITYHNILAQSTKIYEANLKFRRYQDIQTLIITIFFAFLIAFLVYSKYFV